MGAFAVLYGVVRTAALFADVALFFGLAFPDANFAAALLVLGAVCVPLGLAVFRAGERYAKRHGKLKRSG